MIGEEQMDAGLTLMTVSHWVTDTAGTGRVRQSETLPVRPALADQFNRGELTEEQFWSKAMFEHISRKPPVVLGDIHWNPGRDDALALHLDGHRYIVQAEGAGVMSAPADSTAVARVVKKTYVVYEDNGDSHGTGIEARVDHMPDDIRALVAPWIRANLPSR
jgi:hypothetical protein